MEQWAGMLDQQLIVFAQGGQPEAYGELVRRYQADVFNVAHRLLGEQQEALDLSQESFVRGYQALDRFDPSRPFGPWIKRITTNGALNWLQKRRLPTLSLTHQATSNEPAEEWALPDETAEPERLYLAGERQTQLRTALLSLPPHYRAVIELRHMQDLSYDEIAAALQLPVSDVKSHLFRARQLLRKSLEGYL
jgi:RNA polymerase sigma-70 factor (ECF subfamily)